MCADRHIVCTFFVGVKNAGCAFGPYCVRRKDSDAAHQLVLTTLLLTQGVLHCTNLESNKIATGTSVFFRG